MTVKTYQDLLAAQNKAAFVANAIADHKASADYNIAADAKDYYNRKNPTINRYEKLLYDMAGKAHVDRFSANHKLASSFFPMVIDQEVNYLLGNGVSFSDENTITALGDSFDNKMIKLATYALWGGTSFGFFNLDKIDVFSILEFVPLYDEYDGELKAGIRFWQLNYDKPMIATLYEADGYTGYTMLKGKSIEETQPKQPYIVNYSRSDIGGEVITGGANYKAFPIFPLKNGQSEIVGRRNTIDALDLIDSGMVNNVDEATLIYWVLQGAGGMDDLDDAKFIERLKTTHVAHTDDGVTAMPQSVEAPYQSTQAAHDTLVKKLYTDFQAFDASAISAGQQTATAIKASYVPLDLKTDKLEYAIIEFIGKVLDLIDIDDAPSFTRNKLINTQEEMQTLLLAAQYFDDEYITKKALTILGDIDQYEALTERKTSEDMSRYTAAEDNNNGADA